MKFLRKTYWYASAYAHKHGWVIVAAIVAGGILFSAFYRVFVMVSQLKRTQYIGQVGTMTLATLPREIQEKLSVGLTQVDELGEIQPGLAERWIVEDDGKTYRFLLKKDVRWQDGKNLVPKDVVYNFTDTQIITTDHEVIFKLKDPFVPFPVVVSQPLFREVVKRTWLVFTEKYIVGTGAYAIVRMHQEGGRIFELEIESPDERLVYRFYPTESQAILAYKKGEIDHIENITHVNELSEWKSTKIIPHLRKDKYVALFFDVNNPLFEKSIRQALNYSIPKIIGEIRAETPIDPRSWAYNKTVKEYAYDKEKAISLLLRSVPKQKLAIELATVAQFQKDAEDIKQLWEDLGNSAVQACAQSKDVQQKSDCPNLGISVKLRIQNVPDVSNFQVMLIAQNIPKDPDQYFMWHSTQQTNFMGYKNPHVDKLLEDGRKTLDLKERRSAYLDFQQYLIEDSPAIFLKHLTLYTIDRI